MRLDLLIFGLFMLGFIACGNPNAGNELSEERGGQDGVVQAGCARLFVPNVTEVAEKSANDDQLIINQFGVKVESATVQTIDCMKADSLSVSEYAVVNQVAYNGQAVDMYITPGNELLLVSEGGEVARRPLQAEVWGETGREVMPIDASTAVSGSSVNLSI